MNIKRLLFVLGLAGAGYYAWTWYQNRQQTAALTTTTVDAMAKARSLINLSETAAVKKARQLGLVPRLGTKDGVAQAAATDFNPNRVNFQVVKNRVTGVKVG